MKIRAGDNVVITTGKDKGKTGQVLRVLATKKRVVVSDANMRTRHIKGGPNRPGEIVKYEASIDISNVMLIDPKTKKRTRVGYTVDAKGRKMRTAKKSGEEVKKGVVAAKKETAAKDDGTKVKTVKSSDKKKTTESKANAGDSKSPFWKKMGFGAEEMADADTDGRSNEDHSVPEQVERSTNRSSQRGS